MVHVRHELVDGADRVAEQRDALVPGPRVARLADAGLHVGAGEARLARLLFVQAHAGQRRIAEVEHVVRRVVHGGAVKRIVEAQGRHACQPPVGVHALQRGQLPGRSARCTDSRRPRLRDGGARDQETQSQAGHG